MDTYETQAMDFAKKWGVHLRSRYIGFEKNEAWADGRDMDHWKCKLTTRGRSYTFDFWMGIGHKGKKPTLYDVLACITKYDPGDFQSFCDEFGYESSPPSDYPRVHKIWKGCVKEFNAVKRLFSQEAIEELYEIS